MSASLRRLAAGLVLTLASNAVIAADGDLDPTFGTGGFRLSGITDAFASVPAGMAIQSDGKIILCESEKVDTNSNDFYIVRLTADGALDTSFSFDGRTTVDFGGSSDVCSSVVVQADGKIVVSGTYSPTKGSSDFAVARLNADGTLDTTGFGSGTGKVTYGFDLGGDNNDIATGLALKANGKIVVVGSASTASNGTDFAVLQLNTDGSRDTSFNLTGRQTVAFDLSASTNKNDAAVSVFIDDQGRIIVAGNADAGPVGNTDFAIARLLPNGQLDADFSADGRATVPFDLGGTTGSNADMLYFATAQRDGRILLFGGVDSSANTTANTDMGIARLLPDGSLDDSFGFGGRTTIAFDLQPNGGDIAITGFEQANGKIVAVGAALMNGGANGLGAAARLNADGTLDDSFGLVGKKTYDFQQSPSSSQLLLNAAMQPTTGKIVYGGALNVIDNMHIDLIAARVQLDLIFADGFE
jgi:uncharacterized delta-60 repeat protein